MKTTLYFDMADVAKLIEHAANSTAHRGTCNQLYDDNFDLISNPEIPPGLIWVKDEGIYLMSNGELAEGETPKTTGLITYALGYDPSKNPDYYHHQVEAVGGDDFAEPIELEWLSEEMKTCKDGYFLIEVTTETMKIGWVNRR